MAEDAAGGRGGRPPRPPRPAIALPTRSTLESLSSPGPMTLVSSFFADDPDSECRSFSQLLAGTTSPPAATAPHRRVEEGWVEGGAGRMEQSRPAGLMVAPSPFFTVPPGYSPAGLLESPGFFMPGLMGSMLGHVDLSHQQPLAQVTAQAAQSNSRMHIQPESSSVLKGTAASLAKPTGFAIPMVPNQHRPLLTSDMKGIAQENLEDHSDQRSQPLAPIVDKPTDDGYNWRKYGQKQVKGCEYPRSYYKCTHLSCPVKKKVERTLDGQVTAIIYKGRHNHQRPLPNKRAKESGAFQSVINELNENTELDSQAHQESSVGPSISKRDRESGYGTPEQLSGSSDGEEMDGPERMADEADDSEPDPKRRNIENQVIESTSHRTVTEPRIIVQTTSEVDLLDDGYRWRKYGQKVVKGNPYPRSYYKCTSGGCNVRKHVERASTDPKSVLTTYEGRHNHAVPTAKNSSHNSANIHRGTDARHNEQQPAALQLKEEHEIT